MEGTVFIIEDDNEMQGSLACLMESVKLKTRVYQDAASFLDQFTDDCIGCVLLDVRMPGMDGMELLDILNERKNHLPVIIITGYGNVPMAVRAIKSGAVDFILKPFNPQELIEKIQMQVAKCAAKTKFLSKKMSPKKFCPLTAREKEILDLIAIGKLNKEIASELSIAISTVEYHRARLMRKMHAKNIAQLLKAKSALEQNELRELHEYDGQAS